MAETITCPSGLTGRVRGMKVREERILADRKLARSGAQLEQILAACWEETLDAGPYDFGGGAVDWNKVLQGDRFYALLQVRAVSYGPLYAFSVSCENRSCRARIEWEVDLRELPVRGLSKSSRATFLSSNQFPTRLPDAGRTATFRLLVGSDERRMAASRRDAGERPITTMLGFRLDSIEGVEARDKQRFIEDLSMADVSHLLGEFSRVDCGVETEIDVECTECFGLTRIELPFEPGFFLPERRREPASTSSSRT
ncbi:MAG: hypothetical protein ACTHU0_27270 [Kofleriaceae bacterium]